MGNTLRRKGLETSKAYNDKLATLANTWQSGDNVIIKMEIVEIL